MKYKCAFCHGEEPPYQPNMSKEEIKKDLEFLNTEEIKETHMAWLESRPKYVREMAKKYPHNQLYKIKLGAPYKYTCAGCVVSPYSFVETERFSNILPKVELRVKVLQSPIGTAGIVATVDPCWLQPISIDDIPDPQLVTEDNT